MLTLIDREKVMTEEFVSEMGPDPTRPEHNFDP